jgi:beta-glucosidase
MTSYNKLNGVWSHYNYDLATTILRNEWGYKGCVVTDWWMQMAKSPEFPDVRDNAYRVRAQVDVLMPGGMTAKEQCYRFDEAQLETLGKPEGLTRAELQRGAKNVLRFALTRLK